MKPYDYAHRSGVRKLTWDRLATLTSHLVELIAPFHPELILGIARAGLFPATLVACALSREFSPIRLTRRYMDQVAYTQPVWKVPIPEAVAGKMVVIVDEIADTGQTLAMVAANVRKLGAVQVVTAALVSHTWANPVPQVSALCSDEFIIFPWAEQVFVNGRWVPNPEVEAGLKAQSRE